MANDLSWSRALRPMIQVDAPAPGIYVAVGPRLLPSWFLAALCPALKHGTDLFWIDAENSFDAYGASYASRAFGWDPRDVLRRVRVARPFNLFQLETMVRRKLPALWREEPVVVSDPFPMLYDEEVEVSEAGRVASNFVDGMKELPAVWMLLLRERQAPPGRERWFPDLIRQASGVAHLQANENFWELRGNHGAHVTDDHSDAA